MSSSPNERQNVRSVLFRDGSLEEKEKSSRMESAPRFAVESNRTSASPDNFTAVDGARMLSSALVANILEKQSTHDPEEALAHLLEDDAIAMFLQSAKLYAQHVGIPEQDAINEMITKISQLEKLWEQVLQRKGLAQLEKESQD